MKATTDKAQIRLTRLSAAYWRITFDNPPLNVMGPQFVREFREIITAIEADEKVKVVVFESAVEGFFLNHSDFHADMKDRRCEKPERPPSAIAPAMEWRFLSTTQRGGVHDCPTTSP